MTNEEIRVYLQYTKVLLAMNKIRDPQVDEALEMAIASYSDENEPEREYFL